jgi:hypothetical protein
MRIWATPEEREQNEARLARQGRRGKWRALGLVCVFPFVLLAIKICQSFELPGRTYGPIVTGIGLTLGGALGSYIGKKKGL